MQASKNAYDFIIREEGGIIHNAYRCQAGVLTIGVGSTMYKDGSKVKEGDVITDEKAMDLLKWEIENKTHAISGYLKNVVLNQNQVDSLISFVYNIGVGGFAGSTLLKRVRQNPKDPTIKDAFMMWNKIHNPKTGKLEVSEGLTNRRRREAALYFK